MIREDEAAGINHAVECIVDRGMSTWEAAASLNGLELRPWKSTRWTGARLRDVLLNGSALSGKWVWCKGRETETVIEVPAILSPERHEALMAALERTRRATPYRKHFYLLGGGRITSLCGGRMQGWTSDGWKASAPVYKCPSSWTSVPKDERCGCQTLPEGWPAVHGQARRWRFPRLRLGRHVSHQQIPVYRVAQGFRQDDVEIADRSRREAPFPLSETARASSSRGPSSPMPHSHARSGKEVKAMTRRCGQPRRAVTILAPGVWIRSPLTVLLRAAPRRPLSTSQLERQSAIRDPQVS